MKTKILSLLFGAFTVILSSCSSDIVPESGISSGNGDTFLRLEIEKQDLNTRGIITSTTFEKGDSVFVLVRDAEHPDPLTYTTKAVYNGVDWTLLNIIDLASEVYGVEWTTANVEVYYPYETFAKAYDPRNPFRIIVDNPLDQEDLLCGIVKGVSKENPTAKVTCEHLKARLTFELKNNSEDQVNISKLSATTEGEQLFIGRYCYVQNGYLYTPDEYTKDYSISCAISIPAGMSVNVDVLIPPTQEAYEMMQERMEMEGISKSVLKFSLETEDRTINFDIDAKYWSPGQQYTFPVNLSKLPEMEPSKIHMYTTYDGKPVYWSNINIGATSDWDYGRLFGWADPSGKKTSEDLDDYPSANPPTNIAGTEYDIATVNWGGKWRMPSNSDIWDLRRCANYEAEWTEVNGVYGVRITSNETGNSIFLPHAPQRVGTSIDSKSTYYTHYWLSELNEDDPQKAQTLFFNYSTNYENPLTFWASVGIERYNGLPVRPIWIDD